MYSNHPFCPYIPEGATKLIVGTMPPYRFCIDHPELLDKEDVNFYYGSNNNGFWGIIQDVTGVQLDFENSQAAVNQRKDLLAKLNVGITDIVKQCIHENEKSDDASLKEIEQKPLIDLLSQYPKIDTLIYTSGAFLIKQINKIADKHYHSWETPRKTGFVTINGKKYNVIVLYSPSRMALRSIDKDTRLRQYKLVFGN